MGKAKRTLGVIMAALMLVVTCMTYVPAKAAVVLPTVKFVGLQNIPAAVGEEQTLFLTSDFTGNVEYQVFYLQRSNPAVKTVDGWKQLGSGWTTAADAKTPVEVKVPAGTITVAGNYSFAIRVKRAGVTGSYSNTYGDYDAAYAFNYAFAATATAGLKDAKLEKAEVAVGEKFVISGLTAGSSYRLFTLNEARTPRWDAAAVATSTTDKLEWAPTVAGKYVLDLQLTDASGKVTAVKLFNVTVVDALKVTGVSAINKTTVKVTYNMDLGSVVAANFAVYDKGNEYALKTISSVAVDKNVATITLADALTTTKEYTVESKNVANLSGKVNLASSKDNFTYTEVKTAASIAFKSTTVGVSSKVKYIIKDKDGNDITPNFVAADVLVESSNASLVNPTDLSTGTTTGTVIVNLTVKDTTITTGNTIISVISTLLKPTTIGNFGIVGAKNGAVADYAKATTYIFDNATSKYIQFEALDQNGDEMAWNPSNTTPVAGEVTKTFKSYSPTVAVVDEVTGQIFPVATGTATILVTAKDANSVSVSKTITVEVKAAAAINSLKLDKTAVTVVKKSDIKGTVTVNVLDQYGKVIPSPSKPLTYTLNGVTSTVSPDVDGNYAIEVAPDDNITEAKSAVMTITCGTLKAYVTVNYVLAGTFAGYKVVSVDGNTLDLTTVAALSVAPTTTSVVVYQVDTNGNNILVQDTGVTLTTESKGYVTTSGQDVTGKKVGSEVVTVKVGTVTVGTITYTVVNSTKAVTSASLVNSVVSVKQGNSVFNALFGTTVDGAAFVGYDQYGNKMQISNTDVQAFSSNSSVVSVVPDGNGMVSTMSTGSVGTATITVLVAGKVYTVTVKVVE